MTDTDLDELDALRRAGILTEGEYSQARDKVVARHRVAVLLPSDEPDEPDEQDTVTAPIPVSVGSAAPRHAAARGRHAKPPRRWPWIVGSAALLGAAVTVGIVLRPATHPSHTHQQTALSPSTGVRSSAIVVASPANTPMAINLDGADARVAVSKLIAAPAAKSAPHAAPAATMTTYTAMVTIAGTTGTFTIAPAEFTAHSLTGRTYDVAATPLTTLHSTTVGAGQHATGAIAFTVPSSEHIEVVLFTTPLGEQLGLWATS